MRTKTLLFTLLLFSAMVSAQEVKRVAILETVDKENQIDYAYELLLRGNLSDAITSISGYEAYDRTDIDAIMSEQSFQRTGLVSSDQIKRLGEMTGASYILVAEMAKSGQQIIILSKLLDVETARTIMSDHEITTLNEIQDACKKLAKRMFHEEVMEEPKVETNFELVRHTAQEQKMFGVKKYSYGDTQMEEKAFREFLYKNNREAYLNYMKNQQMIYAGWGLFAGGLIMGGAGVACLYIGYSSGSQLTALMFMPLGFGSCVLAGIPLLSVGYTRDRNFINKFNAQNSQQPALTLNLQASQNGIGLALKF